MLVDPKSWLTPEENVIFTLIRHEEEEGGGGRWLKLSKPHEYQKKHSIPCTRFKKTFLRPYALAHAWLWHEVRFKIGTKLKPRFYISKM